MEWILIYGPFFIQYDEIVLGECTKFQITERLAEGVSVFSLFILNSYFICRSSVW